MESGLLTVNELQIIWSEFEAAGGKVQVRVLATASGESATELHAFFVNLFWCIGNCPPYHRLESQGSGFIRYLCRQSAF
jgi:hypothetical protein